jgi:serine/threonine protein kinase
MLGRGSNGEVRRGTFHGAPVALKSTFLLQQASSAAGLAMMGISGFTEGEREFLSQRFMQECQFLQQCAHPNILPFYGVVVDQRQEPRYLVMQYIADGTLHDLIYASHYAQLRTDAGCLPLEAQVVALVGLFSALEYLATVPMIHRDVKPANILVVLHTGELQKVLLTDFGEAKQMAQSMTRAAASVAGTPLYMAPEMREAEDAKTPKADVFSAGVTIVELSTSKPPAPGPELRRIGRERVAVPETERRAADLAAVRHPEIQALAHLCIVDDEVERAPAAELVRRCRALLEVLRTPVAEFTILVHHVETGRRLEMPVTVATTLAEVKQLAAVQTGVPAAQQQLVFAGRAMQDGRTVGEYNVLGGTTVHLLVHQMAHRSAEKTGVYLVHHLGTTCKMLGIPTEASVPPPGSNASGARHGAPVW